MANNSGVESMHCERRKKKEPIKSFHSDQPNTITVQKTVLLVNYPGVPLVHALGHTCISDPAQAHRQVTRLANRKTVLQNSNCQLKALLTLQKEARLLGRFGQPRMISGTGNPL